ncbi:MAG: hypothetical protein WBP29_09035 [Candidatus Zixiibacteriota bacterium]
MLTKFSRESGFTTLIFLSLLLMLSLLGINAIMTSTNEVDIAGYEMNSQGALYAAEAGLEKGAAFVRNYYNKFGKPPTSLPDDSIQIGKFAVTYEVVKPGVTVSKIMTQGAYRGLYALSDEYVISATATAPGVAASKSLQMTVDASVVPIYQFAVFYENELEIAPGPAMTLGGRVHSNGDMYLQSENSLKIDSYTTAAGEIFHGRHPNSGMSTSSGSVEIKDASGVYRSMKSPDNTWLDSTDPDWVNNSISRWGGKVEDKNHGMTELKLPVVASNDPMDMITRAGADNVDSYEKKAGLKVIDGQVLWRKPDSTWQNVTTDFTNTGILTQSTFRDGRENKDVVSYDIDIAKLNTSAYWPDGGIVYTANEVSGSLTATKLKNGSTLKEGLTVASENPVYTQGDYNSVNKKPASIMADALTILSNNWTDANSWNSTRTASDTKVNAAYMCGNKASGTGGDTYSGGFENLPRFLENWSGKKFTWKGSAVDLWRSEKATGTWGGSYYSPPNRDWTFDTDFLDPSKLPPGTPLIAIVMKTSWREITAPSYVAE